ncbi:hypothetical protein G6F68_010577 [Rhizopus microsporus]|nr:hypothetical protein G6F68_010577 [Rhizopus microsporus]
MTVRIDVCPPAIDPVDDDGRTAADCFTDGAFRLQPNQRAGRVHITDITPGRLRGRHSQQLEDERQRERYCDPGAVPGQKARAFRDGGAIHAIPFACSCAASPDVFNRTELPRPARRSVELALGRFQSLPVRRAMLVQALAFARPVDAACRFVGDRIAHPRDVIAGRQFGDEEHRRDAGAQQHDVQQAAEPARALALEVLLEGQVEADDAEHDPDDGDQEAQRGQQPAPEAGLVHRFAVMDRRPRTGNGNRQCPVAAEREQVIEQFFAVPGRCGCHVGSLCLL